MSNPPVQEYLQYHRRFAHLLRAPSGEEIIAQIQAQVDRKWDALQHKAEHAS